MVDLLTGWTQGQGKPADLQLLDDLSEAHEAWLDLWAGAVRARAHHFGVDTFPRGAGGARSRASLSGRRVSDGPRMSDVQLTIDGLAVTVPDGDHRIRCRPHERHRDSDALPSTERNAGGRMPRVPGRSRRTRAGRLLRASGRKRDGGFDQHSQSDAGAENHRRTVDGGPSQPLRAPAPFGRLRARNAGPARRRLPVRASRTGYRRAARMNPPTRSPSITKPASCATAAFAAAAKSGKQRSGTARQGLPSGHRVRSEPAHGQLVVRVVRRMHGFLPHRRADQSHWWCRRCSPMASRSAPKS